MILTCRQIDDLPGASHVPRYITEGNALLDDYAEKPLVESTGKVKFVGVVAGSKPCLAQEEEDSLTASRRFVERPFPALTGGNTALGVEIEEKLVPAFGNEPVSQRDR